MCTPRLRYSFGKPENSKRAGSARQSENHQITESDRVTPPRLKSFDHSVSISYKSYVL
jgi:hypothetical protein